MNRTHLLLLCACANDPQPKASPSEVGPDSDEPGLDSHPPDSGDSPPPDSGDSPAPDSGDSPPPDSGDSAPPDTAPSDSGVEVLPDTEETIESPEDPSAWLFSADEVHLIEIELSDGSVEALAAEPREYTLAHVTIDGMRVPDVGLRLKGKIGSFRTMERKSSFKLDFNLYVDGRDFFGINKLNLNSAVVDCSYLKDYLAYSVFRDLGLAAERTGSAWVTVNGEDYGLYVLLEQPDDRLLERHYAVPTGNLYDGKYTYYDDGSYTLLDFGAGVDSLYMLEEGTDVANADIAAISTLVQDYGGRPEFWATSETLVDWDRLLLYFAAEEFVGHNDGYCLNTNNNFPYFDAEDGRLEMLPWDMDYSFLQAGDWGMDWNRPRGRLAVACRRSTDCMALWTEKVSELVDTIDSEAYMVMAQEHAALLQPYIEADPRRECGLDSVAWYQSNLQTWFTNRETTMTGRWGL